MIYKGSEEGQFCTEEFLLLPLSTSRPATKDNRRRREKKKKKDNRRELRETDFWSGAHW